MKNLKYLILAVALLSYVMVQAQDNHFRVVGYTRNNARLPDEVKNLRLDMITHLNIAFVNPDSTGKLNIPAGLKKAVRLAHQKHVKILISIAGGSPPKYLPVFLGGDKQAGFIRSLVKLTVDNKLDGIDVDLENRMIDSNYESFVTNLALVLRAKNKLITAAIATYYAAQYTDKALAQFDFLNEMSYDKTGPWNANKPGQHAPYDMAVQDLDYWISTRAIPKQKVSLGLPFYGYGFGANAPEYLSYKDLAIQYPDAENTDQITLPGGGIVYYNGAPTIKAKTRLALQKAGGVMIWQLLQDAGGEKSLLKVIDKEIKAKR